MSKVLFVGTGSKRRKYAGQTIDATYEFSVFNPASPPIPGQAVVLTAAGVVGYGSAGDVPYGIIETVEDDGMVTVSRYGIIREAHVVTAFASVGVLRVAVDGAGKLRIAADAAGETPAEPGRTALVDMFVADRGDGIRVAALTLL